MEEDGRVDSTAASREAAEPKGATEPDSPQAALAGIYSKCERMRKRGAILLTPLYSTLISIGIIGFYAAYYSNLADAANNYQGEMSGFGTTLALCCGSYNLCVGIMGLFAAVLAYRDYGRVVVILTGVMVAFEGFIGINIIRDGITYGDVITLVIIAVFITLVSLYLVGLILIMVANSIHEKYERLAKQ